MVDRFLMRSGCQRRLIPKEYPKKHRRLLCYCFTICKDSGILNKVLKKISWRDLEKQ
jgi:hypothetical protein